MHRLRSLKGIKINSKDNKTARDRAKFKRIDIAPCNKINMANKLLSTNLERLLRRINSALTR